MKKVGESTPKSLKLDNLTVKADDCELVANITISGLEHKVGWPPIPPIIHQLMVELEKLVIERLYKIREH